MDTTTRFSTENPELRCEGGSCFNLGYWIFEVVGKKRGRCLEGVRVPTTTSLLFLLDSLPCMDGPLYVPQIPLRYFSRVQRCKGRITRLVGSLTRKVYDQTRRNRKVNSSLDPCSRNILARPPRDGFPQIGPCLIRF